MLVPNDEFLTGFKGSIRHRLAQFPGRNFELTSCQDSLAILPNQETKQTDEALIIDTVANAKGLEKLIIICIGLDEKLGDQKTNCETRALIYQALTRAQLQVVVVNQLLPGGWFEFLGKVKFKEDIFDESSAMKETTTQAASQSISQTVPSVESRAAASHRHPPSPGRTASFATQRDSHVPPAPEPEPPIVSTDQGIDQLKEQDSSVWDTDNDFDTKQIQQLQFDPRKEDPAKLQLPPDDDEEDPEQVAADEAAAAKYAHIARAARAGDLPGVRGHLRRDRGSLDQLGDLDLSALHWAARNGHPAIVAFLVAKGAAVDGLDGRGRWTPLHFAADNGQVECAQQLLAAKASVDIKNDSGKTPLDYAREEGRTEIMNLMGKA
ncbi:unnamed protein product, partial [Cladocopium goreaui]